MAASLSPPPVTADRILQSFAREFCVLRSNRVERLKSWKVKGWEKTGSDKEYAANFLGYEKPPTHISYTLRTKGSVVGGGEISIIASSVEYKNSKVHGYRDGYHATIWIKPESLLSQATIERILKVALVPNGPVSENPGIVTTSGGGEPTRITKPFARWLQHYNANNDFAQTVSMDAMHIWGDVGNEQSWRVSCSTFRAPTKLKGS